MSRILPFPKEKSKKAAHLQKLEGQRLFLTLSLFSFILVAVFSNEQVMRGQRPVYLLADNSPGSMSEINRAIASAQPMNLFRDVEWEHQLAKRLAGTDDRRPASLAKRIDLMDQLRYGVLAGKYRMISTSGAEESDKTMKVSEVEYVDSLEIADRPVQISDREKFLMEYRDLFPVEFQKAELFKQEKGFETWSLLGADGKIHGEAELRINEDGQFLGFKVHSLERMAQ